MFEDVIGLLKAFGVSPSGVDPLLTYLTKNVTERIKNETNQDKIPDGLHYAAVERIVGEYLNFKKNSGQLEIEGLNLETAVKQIQEGDTNMVFAIGEGSQTPEQRLDHLIDYLINGQSREILRYRKMVW